MEDLHKYINSLYPHGKPPEIIFNGKTLIFTTKLLPIPDDGYEKDIEIIDKKKTYHYKFAVAEKNIDMTLINKYPKVTNEVPLIQYGILDNIFAYYNSKMFLKIGSKYFNNSESKDDIDIGGGTLVRKGFHQGIRTAQIGNGINIDKVNSAFIKSVYMTELMVDILSDWRNKFDLKLYENKKGRCSLKYWDIQKIKGEIMSYKVECEHQGFKRIYMITGISDKSSDETVFKGDDGKDITVSLYFLNKYNIRLKYPSFPCLLLGAKKISMPIELCKIKDNQRRKKKVSDVQQGNMVRETSSYPNIRRNEILKIIKNNEKVYNDIEKEIGVKVNTKMLEVYYIYI